MSVPESILQIRVTETLATSNSRLDVSGRRNRIRAAVVQECAEYGFLESNVTRIATRASVSTATLYRDYTDKLGLFVDALDYAAPLITESLVRPFPQDNPRAELRDMVLNHGSCLDHPYLTWLYSTFIGLEKIDGQDKHSVIMAGLLRVEMHWHQKLTLLETQGYLQAHDHFSSTTLLLGPVERLTIVARLLFGANAPRGVSLKTVAAGSADALIALYGTEHFHACERSQKWINPSGKQ